MDIYNELKSALSKRSVFGDVRFTYEQFLQVVNAVDKVYGNKCPMCDDCPHNCKLNEEELDEQNSR